MTKKANDLEDAKNNLKNSLDKNQQMSERLASLEKKSHTEIDQFEVRNHDRFFQIFLGNIIPSTNDF